MRLDDPRQRMGGLDEGRRAFMQLVGGDAVSRAQAGLERAAELAFQQALLQRGGAGLVARPELAAKFVVDVFRSDDGARDAGFDDG
jgi:hypothetical protein